jgi:phosphatidate phosphatase APP1
VLERALAGRGWVPRVVPHVGYGTTSWVRVLARVVLAPPGARAEPGDLRGWRSFATASAVGVPVTLSVGSTVRRVVSDRDGYLDAVLPVELEPGWREVSVEAAGAPAVTASVRVVDPRTRLGLVSDIDDTVIVTMLPRPLVAFRNAFLTRESARRPVPGMADLYAEIAATHPDVFVVYVSTGAWNTALPLARFLDHHGFPRGPLLLTDWGPTPTGWFRSGAEHKQGALRRLLDELPGLSWVLVGDDGQLDPEIYASLADESPDRVAAIAIRELSLGEQVVGHGTPVPRGEVPANAVGPAAVPEVRARDGFGLRDALRHRGLLA